MSLIAAIEKQENLAETRGELSNDRAQAMDHYLGRPYGNEVEGRSSVVMRDVADTIEWIKPSLMKIFASGDEVVKFEAVGPEDEPSAEQETQYCNHVLMRRNNGFLIFHDWFHDALLQKRVTSSRTTSRKNSPRKSPIRAFLRTSEHYFFRAKR